MNLSDLDRIELTNCLQAALADLRSVKGTCDRRIEALERCLTVVQPQPKKKNGGDSGAKTATR